MKSVVAGIAAVVVVLSACSGSRDGATTDPGAAAPGDSALAASAQPLDFTATTLAGDDLDVGALAGEPVVLWFWAPWCTICRAEAPEVAEVASDLAGEVRVLGVPGLGPEADMRAFVDDTGTGRIDHLVDTDGSLWQRFGVISQPAYAFVSRDGSTEVFAGALGGEDLRSRAEALASD